MSVSIGNVWLKENFNLPQFSLNSTSYIDNYDKIEIKHLVEPYKRGGSSRGGRRRNRSNARKNSRRQKRKTARRSRRGGSRRA